MSYSTESDRPSFSHLHLIEQALKILKQSISTHLDQESRLENMWMGCHQNWMAQCEQLRMRVETLEARLAPWMTDSGDGPRLAVIPGQEEAA